MLAGFSLAPAPEAHRAVVQEIATPGSARFGSIEAESLPKVAQKVAIEIPAKPEPARPVASAPAAAKPSPPPAQPAPAARPAPTPQPAPAAQPAPAPQVTDKLSQARAILASKIATYPILQGTTVEFGDAQGYQAIAYYQSGRIIINPNHTASLERIIAHEIWHIIDWRDNGQINWGENVPPRNEADFRR